MIEVRTIEYICPMHCYLHGPVCFIALLIEQNKISASDNTMNVIFLFILTKVQK